MAKVLVTGGLGYIGSHTVVDLVEKNHTPLIVDDLSNSRMEVLKGLKKICHKEIDFEIGDIRDREVLEDIFAKNTIESVIHFAANKAVKESVSHPLKYYSNNIGGLLNLLSIGEVYGLKSMIFSSSCTVYGNADELPVTEQSPTKPAESPYGNTKQIGEEILMDYCRSNPGFKAISLRYFNPIGAHDSSLIGELPLGIPANLVPYLTQTAIGKREKLLVFGNDYHTPDGTCIRDYVHVSDLADAHIKAMQYTGQMTGNYEVFNVGTGTGRSVLEVINTFQDATGVTINYEIAARRSGDVEKIFADPTKANTILGWHAQRDLKQMLVSAWEWQKKIS